MAVVAAITAPMPTGKRARGRILGGRTTGGPRRRSTGTLVMTTQTWLSLMLSPTRLTLAISSPTGQAPVATGAPVRPTCRRARRVPVRSAACLARPARRAPLARLHATPPPSAAPGRVPTMPLAARGRVPAAPVLDRKGRLALVRAMPTPSRARRPALGTRRLPGLVPPGQSPADSARPSRREPRSQESRRQESRRQESSGREPRSREPRSREPGRIPPGVPASSSRDSQARPGRRHRTRFPRAATHMDRPSQKGASQVCR